MKFTYKLLFFWILLVVIPVVLLGFSIFQRKVKTEKEMLTRGRLEQARLLAEEVGDHFQEMEAALGVLGDLYPKINQELLISFLHRMPLIKSLALLDRTGKPIVIVPPTSTIGENDNSRALYFTEPMASAAVYLPDIVGVSAAFMSQPIPAPAGKIPAVLVCEIDINRINQDFLGTRRPLEKSFIFLVDKQGDIFPPPLRSHSNFKGSPVVRKILSGPAEGAGQFRLGRSQMFAAYARVPFANWWVVLEQPAAEVFPSAISLGYSAISMLALSIVGMSLIGFLGARLFAHPITKLTRATRELALGKYEAKVDIKTGDEFEELGDGFNRMAERIHGYFSVSRALARSVDVESVARNVVTIVQAMVSCRAVAFYRNGPETGELIRLAFKTDGSSADDTPFSDDLRRTVVTSGMPYGSTDGAVIPIAGKDKIYGLLEVVGGTTAIIDEEVVKELEQIAQQMALALANAELYSEVTRKAEEQAALYRVIRVASQSLKLDEILSQVLDEVLAVTKNDLGSIYLWDETRQKMVLKYHKGLPADFVKKGDGLRRGGSYQDSPLRTGEAFVIEDLPNAPIVDHKIMQVLKVQSGAFIPLKAKGEIVGAMQVATFDARRFGTTDQKFLTAVGEAIGVALSNAQHFADVTVRLTELQSIQKLGAVLAQELDEHKVVKLVTTYALTLTGATGAWISLVTPDRKRRVYLGCVGEGTADLEGTEADLADTLQDRVIKKGEAIVSNDLPHDRRANKKIATDLDMRTAAVVPLRVKDQTIGCLIVFNQKVHRPFGDHQFRLLTIFANQAAIAIQNARLHGETSRRVVEQKTVSDTLGAIADNWDINQIFPAVVEGLRRLTGCERIELFLIDGDRTRFVIAALDRFHSELQLGTRVPFSDTSVAEDVLAGRVHLSPDIADETRYPFEQVLHEAGYRTRISIPVTHEKNVTGALNLISRNPAALDKMNLPFLEQIADALGIAVKNSRLFASEQKKVLQLETINQVSREFAGILDFDMLLPEIVKVLQGRFNNYCTYLTFVETGMVTGKAIATPSNLTAGQTKAALDKLRLPIDGNSMNGWVVRSDRSLMVNDVRNDFRHCALEQSEETRSEIVVPIRLEEKVIGTLGFQSDKLNAFDETDLWTLEHIADQVAVVIKNAQLYEQTAVFKKMTDAAIEDLTSGLINVDKEGNVILFNRAMEEILGVPMVEIVGKPPQVVQEALETPSCPFKQVLETGTPLVYHETKLKRADGFRLVIGMSITPLLNEEKKIIGAVGLFVDLTALKALAAKEQHVRDLVLLGETVTRLAHEIKNPLASILSGIQLIQRRLKPGGKYRDHFEAIINEIRRLDESLKELLVFSKPKEPEFSRENPLLPLENALKLLEPQIGERQINLVLDFDSALPPFRMDPQKMEQVFLNLILNAIQASEPGGEIRVSAQVQTNKDFSTLRYEVTNQGCNIPKEKVDKIFDPFFSTKTHGIGLGLPIVRRIVEEHGGTVSVKSKPDQGTTFIVRLTTEES